MEIPHCHNEQITLVFHKKFEHTVSASVTQSQKSANNVLLSSLNLIVYDLQLSCFSVLSWLDTVLIMRFACV